MTLESLRKEFEADSNRSVSMPIAGALVWTFVGVVSTQLNFSTAIYIMLFATGAIFPLALLIANFRKEALVTSQNPLARLMGMCVIMVNLLWGVHIPLLLLAPQFVPLSLGIGLGLHWIVYSWIIKHPLGLIHSILRTLLVVAAWYLFPESRIFAVSMAIVLVYCISISQMLGRRFESD